MWAEGGMEAPRSRTFSRALMAVRNCPLASYSSDWAVREVICARSASPRAASSQPGALSASSATPKSSCQARSRFSGVLSALPAVAFADIKAATTVMPTSLPPPPPALAEAAEGLVFRVSASDRAAKPERAILRVSLVSATMLATARSCARCAAATLRDGGREGGSPLPIPVARAACCASLPPAFKTPPPPFFPFFFANTARNSSSLSLIACYLR